MQARTAVRPRPRGRVGGWIEALTLRERRWRGVFKRVAPEGWLARGRGTLLASVSPGVVLAIRLARYETGPMQYGMQYDPSETQVCKCLLQNG